MKPVLKSLFQRLTSGDQASFFNEFLRFASSSSVLKISQMGSNLVVAALLDPTVWGYWYLLNLIIAYGALTQFGVLNGMNRQVPAALGSGDKRLAVDLRRNTLAMVLAAAILTSVGLAIASQLITQLTLTPELWLTCGLLIATQLYAYVTMSLKSTTEFRALSRIQWVESGLYPVLTVTGVLVLGLPGFIAGQILSLLACSAFSVSVDTVVWRPRLSVKHVRQLIGVGFPIMLVGLTYTVLTTVDRWVIGAQLGPEALGQYALAIMTLAGIGFLPNVLSQQFYPRMAHSWAANRDTTNLEAIAAHQRRYTFAVVVPVVALFVALLPTAVRTFLPAYAPAIPAILVTAIAPILAAFGQGYGGVLNVLNRQYWYLGAIAIAILVNLGVSLLLIGSYGMSGVAWGTVTAYLTLAVLRILLGRFALQQATLAS